MWVICRKVSPKPALIMRTLTYPKRSHATTLSVWTEEIQAKSERWTTQTAINCDTFWLQSFGRCNSYLANAKIDMLLYCYCFVLLCISKYKPPGVYIQRGDLTEGFLRYGFGGLYLEVLIHGMAYFRNFTVITTLLRPKQPNRYYVSFMQTRFCPPAFISFGRLFVTR